LDKDDSVGEFNVEAFLFGVEGAGTCELEDGDEDEGEEVVLDGRSALSGRVRFGRLAIDSSVGIVSSSPGRSALS